VRWCLEGDRCRACQTNLAIQPSASQNASRLSCTFQYALNAQQVLLEANHGIGCAARHFGFICQRRRGHTAAKEARAARPRGDASMHRTAAHGTAVACFAVSMHAMQTCIRRSMRGIAHARWVQGDVGSAHDPRPTSMSAAKTRHTAQAHTRDTQQRRTSHPGARRR
jgi:hypothetical protein